jgi:hypothetical protein
MLEAELNKFIISLARMRVLAEYFPDGYDFGVDLHDPIVYDLIELSAQSQSVQQAIDSEAFMAILLRGMKRHITAKTRNQIYEALERMTPQAMPRHKKLIKKAQRALEDMNIDPAIIGLSWQLYVQHLFDKAVLHSDLQSSLSNPSLKKLIDKLEKKLTPGLIDEIVAFGESAVYYLDNILEENFIDDLEPDLLNSMIEILCRLPCHYAARLLGDIAIVSDLSSKKIIQRCRESEQQSFVTIYLVNKLEKSGTDLFERWYCHEYLVTQNDPRAFRYLRDELLYRELWTDHPQKDDLHLSLSFYSQLIEWTIRLKDRRAVPVFIKLLYYGEKMGYQKEILEIAEDLIANTKWSEEIQQGLYLLKEGETVFVEKSHDAMAQLNENLEKYTESMTTLHGKPPKKADIRQRVSYDTRRWNEAYHDDLDGLRPVDLPEPEIKLELLQRMMIEFEKKVRRRNISRKKAMRILPRFQGKWLTTPRPELDGDIPLVLIMRETEMLAKTRAQKEHYQRYKEETINGLYLEAALHFDSAERTDAIRKINTVLALDPDYPFAKRLKARLYRETGDD